VISANAQSQGPLPSTRKEIKVLQKQPSTQQQKTEPDKRGTEQTPFVVKTIPAPKSHADTEQDRKDQNKKASQLRWAFWLTIVVAAATLLQAIFLFFTLRATRKAADAATRTAKVAEDALYFAERAYLSIDKIEFDGEFMVGSVAKLKLKIINDGKTPAKIIDISARVKFVDKIPSIPDYPIGQKSQSQMIIRSGGEKPLVNIKGDIVTPEQFTDMFKGTQILFIWGRIIYQDIFKKFMVVGFGAEFFVDNFLPVNGYNYIEEYEPEKEQPPT
jgi:hypothetical protein